MEHVAGGAPDRLIVLSSPGKSRAQVALVQPPLCLNLNKAIMRLSRIRSLSRKVIMGTMRRRHFCQTPPQTRTFITYADRPGTTIASMSMLVYYSDSEDEKGHPPPDAKDGDLSENLEGEQLAHHATYAREHLF